MGATFLTNLKVAINQGFSWGMSRTSKGEGCQKEGGQIQRGEDLFVHCKICLELPKYKPPHKCTILNKLD